jgi:hypothetical protein
MAIPRMCFYMKIDLLDRSIFIISLWPATVAQPCWLTADGKSCGFFVGIENSRGPGRYNLFNSSNFLPDDSGQFGGIRHPQLDQVTVLSIHIMDFLHLRDGRQLLAGVGLVAH